LRRNFDSRSKIFPPEAQKTLKNVQQRDLTIKTICGDVVLKAAYGQDRESGQMVMPLQEKLGLDGSMSPALEDRLCHLAVVTASYSQATESAKKFGISTNNSQIQRLVQRMGGQALEQEAQRISAAFDRQKSKEIIEKAELELKGERFSMVLMLDGTKLRARGDDWGMKPETQPGDRVAWHELKAGLVIRVPEASDGQQQEAEKWYVAADGGPELIGRKLYAEALHRGLNQAQRVCVVADGAAWIWNLAAEHFPGSLEELDFYHASEHMWGLARALNNNDEDAAKNWVTPLLHNLKHQGGEELLSVLDELSKTAEAKELTAEQQKTLNREVAYFHNHKSRLDYPKVKSLGLPIGSGSMESACSQLQGRFKRTGQFWSRAGERNLLALELARRNNIWDKIWVNSA